MSTLRIVFCCLMVSHGMAHAQGSTYSETKRVEDAALERARRMKALKEDAAYEPAPRDLNPSPRTAAVNSRSMQRPEEPFRFQVVTPQGLIPLEEWQAQKSHSGAQSTDRTPTRPAAPAPAEAPKPSVAAPEPKKTRSLRLDFFSVSGGRGETEPNVEGRAVSLGGSKGTGKSPAGPPTVEVTPVVQPVNAKPKLASSSAPAARPEAVAEVVAVTEEIESSPPGGEPKRRLLGFLSGRGVEAAAQASTNSGTSESPAAPAQVENRPPAKVKPAASAQDQVASSPTPAVTEETEQPSEKPEPDAKAGRDREAFLKGLGELLASSRRETFKLAWVPPKYSEGGASAKPEEATMGGKAENLEYFTIKTARAPFHVIDTGERQTQLVELEVGTVGRKHGEGDEWTWMQLDSGLMGLMKKRYIRPAMESEVAAFLAAEAKSGTSPSGGGRDVRYVDVELPQPEPSTAEETMSVNAPQSPPAPASTSAPDAAQPPATLPSSLEGSGNGGVIAVPSPVPILP